ncbi:lipid storage droplets surface-binding protein 1-like, partial [Atheta coriaria]
MVQNQSRMINLPELEAVNRISNLPIVETGWNYAEYMYQRIKHSNNLLQWTLDQAESSLYNVIDTASPAVFLLEGPLSTIDRLLCKSLDIVEQKVPSIHLPPQMIYTNTKQYVSDVGSKIVRPVLKRADSVKQIGNQVLESKFTAFAADKLDGALSVADMYVDKYLPADVFDKGNEGVDVVDAPPSGSGNAGKALHTGQHMFRFSKKLRRRLTQRTLLEAKALKEQSAEAIHVLVYVAELIATDPKLALQKGRELWATLSKDEPENQARPENLEQLIVLLTRETARRVVHLI